MCLPRACASGCFAPFFRFTFQLALHSWSRVIFISDFFFSLRRSDSVSQVSDTCAPRLHRTESFAIFRQHESGEVSIRRTRDMQFMMEDFISTFQITLWAQMQHTHAHFWHIVIVRARTNRACAFEPRITQFCLRREWQNNYRGSWEIYASFDVA